MDSLFVDFNENPECTQFIKDNYCFKVNIVHVNLHVTSAISGYIWIVLLRFLTCVLWQVYGISARP